VRDPCSHLSQLLKQGSDVSMLRNADTFRRAVTTAARQQRGSVGKAAAALAEKQDEYRKAHQKAEVIRKLRERQQVDHRRATLRDEQKQLDEIGARKVGLRQRQPEQRGFLATLAHFL